MHRRQFLRLGYVAAPLIFSRSWVGMGTPPAIGKKFNPDGSFRSFPGNTIICHVPPHSATFQTLLEIRARFAARPFSRCLTLMPPASYHMTVFEGVVNEVRQPRLWPSDMSVDSPLDSCNQLFLKKLREFDLRCNLPFRLVPDFIPDTFIRLRPFDDQEEQKLRDLRNRLSKLLLLHGPNHEAYQFHITLAYLVKWMTPEETVDYARTREECASILRNSLSVIELGPPEFCFFQNMAAFDPQLLLNRKV